MFMYLSPPVCKQGVETLFVRPFYSVNAEEENGIINETNNLCAVFI